MRRAILVLSFGLAGCQSVPRVATVPEPRPVPVIRLCRHDVPVEAAAVRQELLQIACPGTPLDEARAKLEGAGVRIFSYVPGRYRRSPCNLPELLSGFDEKTERKANSIQLRVPGDEVGAWGQRYFELWATLYFDERMTVKDFEVNYVPSEGRPTAFAWYFKRRPDLRDPAGMPLEQARGLMEAQGFHCTPVAFDKHEKSGRPYLDCRAVAETPLGGSIIRVRLFYDEAGTVTDTRLLKEAEFGDDIVCMLPGRDDSPGQALLKTVVLPLRLYAAVVVGGLEVDLAMGRP